MVYMAADALCYVFLLLLFLLVLALLKFFVPGRRR